MQIMVCLLITDVKALGLLKKPEPYTLLTFAALPDMHYNTRSLHTPTQRLTISEKQQQPPLQTELT